MRTVSIVVACWVLAPALAIAQPGRPTLRSPFAVVLDRATGTELLSARADEPHPIASTTKIFVALAVRRRGLDLDGWTEITRGDYDAALGGARTRLDIGQTFQNRDLLRAMLLASDNRAPTALARAVGLDPTGLVAEMNKLATELGLKRTTFSDCSGLRGNVSTARELAIGMRAALADPVISEILREPEARIQSRSGYARLRYATTNEPLIASPYHVTGGKTGYTTAAGYCYTTGAKLGDREVVMAFLGGKAKDDRWLDFAEVAAWLGGPAPVRASKVAPTPRGKRQRRR